MFLRFCILPILLFVSLASVAQKPKGTVVPAEGQVEDAEITIEKDRKIELPQQNRNVEKIPALTAPKEKTKLTYQIPDRKLSIGNPRFNPSVQALPESATAESGYSNFVKIGAGNYGRFMAEGILNSRSDLPYGLTIKARHNSSATGPVDGKNSASNQQEFSLNGKYVGNSYKLSGNLGFDREQFYFYGYRRGLNVPTPERRRLEQVLSTISVGAGIENTNKDATIDYSLRTKLTSLSSRTNAAEIDWGTNLKATWPISEQFLAHLKADAYLTQRTDSLVDKRNFFRVHPSFQFKSGIVNVTVGFNAVHETDARQKISVTHGYPVVNIDLMPIENIHFFAGFNGDLVRNTLTGFLSENEFLGRKVSLLNSNKLREFYAGSKGQITPQVSFEVRAGYAIYRNFYVFNNAKPDTSRFEVLYDAGTSNVLNVSGQLNYEQSERWRSSLLLNAYGYDLSTLEKPWHRPSFTATWTNSVSFSKKLLLGVDAYFLAGLSGKNFVSNRVVDLPNILDVNLKTTYLLTEQFSASVSLNNLFSKNYERYLYYQRQGLNFVIAASYAF